MTNPDPARITEPMWRLWTERPNPAWKLSGFYADKKGYHNTVIANKAKWPGTYSIELPLDLVKINNDKERAMDTTMTTAEMIKWTTRMKNSALDPNDHRLAAVREFYGTLDGKTVYGLIKDDEDGPWRRSSADSTHLWHGHKSIFTAFVNNWNKLSPILSVERGDSLVQWRKNTMLVQLGDSGEEVKYWQAKHNRVRNTVKPPAPEIKVDGDYGVTTAKAFAAFVHNAGPSQADYTGHSITGWLALRYESAYIIVSTPEIDTPIQPPQLDPEQVKVLVNNWLNEKVPESLTIKGVIEGHVEI